MSKSIEIALIGNPNCGKTTLFNTLTGSRQHVGNWPGVTVEKKEGVFFIQDKEIHLVDLPGIYGFSTHSIDEVVSKEYLIGSKPDLILNVVDATTVEKSLQLTTQLLEMGIKVILVFNMWDEVEKKGLSLNIEQMSRLLGVPIISCVAKKNIGKEAIESAILKTLNEEQIRKLVGYEPHLEEAIIEVGNILGENFLSTKRWSALKLLEGDLTLMKQLGLSAVEKELIEKISHNIEITHGQACCYIISDARYGFIRGMVQETISKKKENTQLMTPMLDRIFLNKWLGFPIFFGVLWLTFYLTFTIGGVAQDLIGMGVDSFSIFLNHLLPTGALQDLLVNGIVNAVGNILSFLPQIVLLFLMISLMEDSGYMARVAFLMDKVMHLMGIHGKSFISLFSSLGCNVPGIMASRIVESEDDRKITILVNPFIPCSARFAIYIVLVGLFFPHYAYNVIFVLYLIGILVAVLTALLLKKTIFKKQSEPFVMELPPYRIPTFRSVCLHMWDQASMFVKKMSTVIVVGTIIVWALGYFPTHYTPTAETVKLQSAVAHSTGAVQKEYLLELQSAEKSARMNTTYLSQLGQGLTPILEPLGFTWREGVSLISGFIAKEIFISSMIVIYGVSGGAANLSGLHDGLVQLSHMDGLKMFSLLVFVTLYVPCVATLAVIRREMRSTRWMIFSVIYGVAVAYAFSWCIYHIGQLFIK